MFFYRLVYYCHNVNWHWSYLHPSAHCGRVLLKVVDCALEEKLLCRQLHIFTFTIPCLSHHRPHFDLVKAKQVNKIVVVILLPVNLETIQAFIWVTGKWFWMALLAHYSVKSSCQSLQLSGWMMENSFVLLYLTILLSPIQSKEDLQCVVFTKNIWSNQISTLKLLLIACMMCCFVWREIAIASSDLKAMSTSPVSSLSSSSPTYPDMSLLASISAALKLLVSWRSDVSSNGTGTDLPVTIFTDIVIFINLDLIPKMFGSLWLPLSN